MWQIKAECLKGLLCIFTGAQYKNIGSKCLRKNKVESLNTTKLDDSERSFSRITIKFK